MSIAEEITKLNELKERGILTDVEFQQQKNTLLNPAISPPKDNAVTSDIIWNQLPLRQKWGFQAVLFLLVIPLGIIFMVFCPAYQKRRGKVVRVGKGTKGFLIILGLFVWGISLGQLISR